MQTYRKPDGTMTDDANEYVEAWKELATPITEVTNTRLYGFDPGISLRSREDPALGSVSLPVWFAEALYSALKEEGV